MAVAEQFFLQGLTGAAVLLDARYLLPKHPPAAAATVFMNQNLKLAAHSAVGDALDASSPLVLPAQIGAAASRAMRLLFKTARNVKTEPSETRGDGCSFGFHE